MRRLKYDLKMSDGSLLTYKVDVPDDMTVSVMTERITRAENFFLLNHPSGDTVLINMRHVMSIAVSDITDPA